MVAVAAVIVTYNRVTLLAECLDAIARQSVDVSRVIVVDNASTDGTARYLAGRNDVNVIALTTNTGGAGGFAAGIASAMTSHIDAIWLMDDDTIPQPDALAELLRARQLYPGTPPALVASRVVWVDGRDHPMNTPRSRPGTGRAERDAAAGVGCRPVRSASFVSVLLDRQAVAVAGLPVAAYFLWNDDFEYTARLLRDSVGLYCPNSVVLHKTRAFGSTDADPGERFYYEVRNKLWMFTRSDGLTSREKLLYGGSTVNRWVRTFIDSPRREVLWRGLRQGLRDARRPPPSTDDVLRRAGAGTGDRRL